LPRNRLHLIDDDAARKIDEALRDCEAAVKPREPIVTTPASALPSWGITPVPTKPKRRKT